MWEHMTSRNWLWRSKSATNQKQRDAVDQSATSLPENVRGKENNAPVEAPGTYDNVDGEADSDRIDTPSRREAVLVPQMPVTENTITSVSDRSTASRYTQMVPSTGAAPQIDFALGDGTITGRIRLPSWSWGSEKENTGRLREIVSEELQEKEEEHPRLSQRQTRLLEGWQILRSKRTEAQTIRVNVAELRARLDVKRKEVSSCDDTFVAQALVVVETSSDFEKEELKLSFRRLAEVRAEMSIDESELEIVEEKLILAEGELREVESSMYQLPISPLAGSMDDNFDFVARERDPTESEASSRNIRRNSSVQAKRYLSQVGEVTMLRERMIDLESHFAQVTEEQADRQDIGLPLDDGSKHFLSQYDLEHEELASQLQEAERLLEVYQADLEEIDHHIHVLDPFPEGTSLADGSSRAHSLFGKDDYFDDASAEGSSPEGPSVAAIAKTFLSIQHDSNRVYARESVDEDGDAVNKAEYINSWLLDRLRQSTREITRLATEHAVEGVHLGAMDFRREVLSFWDRDETMQSRFAATSLRNASMTIHSGKTLESRPRSEGHLRVVEENANANVLRRTRSARRPQTER